MARIKIVEVGPRDGLQNEKVLISTDTKVELVERLIAAGVTHIEAASFVSPRWVPQMADSAEVMRRVPRPAGVRYLALTPNLQGLDAALAAGVHEVAVFGSASEAFSRRNINCSIAESLERFRPVLARARDEGLKVRGYVSCAVACPYEGAIAPEAAAEVALRLHQMGCHEIAMSDTIGRGTPGTVCAMLAACLKHLPAAHLAGHYHDTFGSALANIEASIGMGLGTFDSSVAGLGGCPYAEGATGNVASEAVVARLQELGHDTGIDLTRLREAGAFIRHALLTAPRR
ncbi:hydroxymethylglutaryl-CoA lyase [Piscinibacter gummiphilus]|uniref:hydroxymethylglutaryl-CoA lyase n=1 Tax=Piscinibacter gummiphilus TaxID=946333 RepID=A0ABZ0CNX9_9BURK|nr:hydroxymethylglutaryl-CoA lyase [Piscinibacter gummiphilus]WOB06680.1 hydroxymethylglutaryl-CoA lyase [Piscinibacter gummiphilus]